MMITTENWERLGEIQLEMLDLLQESEKIVLSVSQPAKERAKIWINNIRYALSNVNNPIRGQTVTMDDTIFDLEPEYSEYGHEGYIPDFPADKDFDEVN